MTDTADTRIYVLLFMPTPAPGLSYPDEVNIVLIDAHRLGSPCVYETPSDQTIGGARHYRIIWENMP